MPISTHAGVARADAIDHGFHDGRDPLVGARLVDVRGEVARAARRSSRTCARDSAPRRAWRPSPAPLWSRTSMNGVADRGERTKATRSRSELHLWTRTEQLLRLPPALPRARDRRSSAVRTPEAWRAGPVGLLRQLEAAPDLLLARQRRRSARPGGGRPKRARPGIQMAGLAGVGDHGMRRHADGYATGTLAFDGRAHEQVCLEIAAVAGPGADAKRPTWIESAATMSASTAGVSSHGLLHGSGNR